MLRAGAVGYVLKGARLHEILDAIRAAPDGRASLSPEIMGEVIDELGDHLRREALEMRERRNRTRRIRRILETPGAITAAYQPIFDLGTGALVGLEALARIGVEPARAPDVWLLEAEAAGLRIELELAAVRVALAGLEAVPDGSYLSLNLSPGAATSPQLAEALAAAPVDRLVIEVTEHAPVDDYEALLTFVSRLRRRGARLAVDDAGAGFASMHHIVRLVPDIIKLDVSLTSAIDRDPARQALASALISFAGDIGGTIVAEGIETEAELRTLRSLGAHYGQGFHLGRPGPLPVVANARVGA
jgi:EAL domain-containing protein (putative c-di-GMP-specific phosphodiesterase class I)